jgi:outer membrane protein assembly factor BamD (BamD/ComL family)
VSRGYDEQIAELSKSSAQVRKDAVEHFEAFLAKYPHSAYAPHVMFRLGDLYYDEAEEIWYAKDQELQKAMEASPDADLPLPQKDYTKSIALYERIIAEYPKYEYIDGCYYMLGYTHSELNSMQLNEDVGKDWFLKLVNEYPQSEFAADANMRLGEYYFDHNDLVSAIAHYQKVVDQGEGGRLYDRGLYKLAWSYYKKSDYTSARDGAARLLARAVPEHGRRIR